MSACHGTKSKFGKIWEKWENMGKTGKINDILGKKTTLWESGKEVGKVEKWEKWEKWEMGESTPYTVDSRQGAWSRL